MKEVNNALRACRRFIQAINDENSKYYIANERHRAKTESFIRFQMGNIDYYRRTYVKSDYKWLPVTGNQKLDTKTRLRKMWQYAGKSAIDGTVGVTKEKTMDYFRVPAHFAANKEYKFITLRRDYKYNRNVSIDIDPDKETGKLPYANKAEILNRVCELNLPYPTLIVKTDRGYHIHWFLDKEINTDDGFMADYWHLIEDKLVQAFGGDGNAANHNFRNPLARDEEDVTFFGDTYQLTAFNAFFSIKDFIADIIAERKALIKNRRVTKKKKQSVSFATDHTLLEKVLEGSRSITFNSHLIKVYFKLFGMDLIDLPQETLIKKAAKIAYAENERFPVPLSKIEVKAISKSAIKFAIKYFDPHYSAGANYFTSENRAFVNNRTLKKIVDGIIALVEQGEIELKSIYSRSLLKKPTARMLGISKNTYKKYEDVMYDLVTLFLADTVAFNAFYITANGRAKDYLLVTKELQNNADFKRAMNSAIYLLKNGVVPNLGKRLPQFNADYYYMVKELMQTNKVNTIAEAKAYIKTYELYKKVA